MRIRCDYTVVSGRPASSSGTTAHERSRIAARNWRAGTHGHCHHHSRGEDRCAPAIRGSTGAMSPSADAAAGDLVQVRTERGRPVGHALFSDRSEITLRMMTLGAARAAGLTSSSSGWPRRSPTASRWRSTRRRTGWCTARRTGCRRSSSIATATTWSSRRCRRASTGGCRRSPRRWSSSRSRRGILARNDPRVRAARGARADGRGAPRRGARALEVREGAVALRGRSVAGPEDRALSRSAREPRGGAALRARPPARRLQLQRRLRAGAGAALRRRSSRSTSPRMPSRASRRTPRATASRTSRRAR